MMHRAAIIGVHDNGAEGLCPSTLERLTQADVVIGNERTLALFAEHIKPSAQQHSLTGALSKVPEWVRQAQTSGKRVAVLATGDPLCHGIAAYLLSRLCIEAFDILPNTSTIQLACARVSLPWAGVKIVSIHSRDAGEWQLGADPSHGLYPLRQALEHHDQLAVLTSPENTPARVARMLATIGQAQTWQMAVVAQLHSDDESVEQGLAADFVERACADPNVLLLWRHGARPRHVLFGESDDQFIQRQPEKGLITKREVRAVSLARMQLRHDSIVWDIGAGSGSVGVEAAKLCIAGHVYAIEKNAADYENAKANAINRQLPNYSLIHSKAPAGLEHWPDPDAVFIGGSGGELEQLISLIMQRLRPAGQLVMNFVTIENLQRATAQLNALGCQWDLLQLSSARSKPILDMHRLAAENPVWVVCASRSESSV